MAALLQLRYGDPELGARIAGATEELHQQKNVMIAPTKVLHLPDAGIRGNTHFPFSDLNNLEIADLLSRYLHDKGLDKRKEKN